MSDQRIGVESVFGTAQFTKGLTVYLAGIADAVAKTGLAVTAVNAFQNNTVAALTQILGQAQGVATAMGIVTKAIQASNTAAAQAAAAPAPAAAAGAGPTLSDQLRQTQLINDEIRDQVALENLILQSKDKQLTALQQIKNANEQSRIGILQSLRDQEAAQVQLNQSQLDAIRNTAAVPRDTGKDARRELEDELRLDALLQQALKARIAEEQTKRTLLDANLTPLARERALIEQNTQALEAQKRVHEALNISMAAANRVFTANKTPVSDADLGVKARDPLADQLKVQQAISAEISSQIKLKQAQLVIDSAGSSALKKIQAETEKETLLLEQQKRARDIGLSGGNVGQLDAIKAVQVTLADLGQKQVSAVAEQLTLQRILSEEIRDRIGAEQARLVIMNKQSSELQRQQAQISLQDIAARRAANSSTAQTLNIPGSTAAIANIRNAQVATRDLGSAVQKTTQTFQGMSAATTAVAVTIGNLAAGAIRSAVQGLASLGSSILSNVADFENLDLSIGFFTARSAQSKDASLSFEAAMAQTTKQSQALTYWLQQLAVASPFTTKEVGTLFRVSQAYGLTREEAEKLTPLMLDFAAASGLTGDVLERLALAFGQVRARGKLTGEEVRQLGNSGLPIRDILVKELHIANDEFDQLLESGALTSDVVLPAITKALKVFEGQGERISFGTIKGIISAFQEFKEIASATFFRGLLEPLIKDFKAFFEVVNRPDTLAMIKLIGQELGGNLLNAVHSVGAGLQALTADWLGLDPAIKQQILTFGAAFAVAMLVVGAIGLLTVAFGLLTQPVVVAVTLFAFFVSEYSSNFAVLNHITGGWVGTILSLPSKVARGIGGAVSAVGNGMKAIGTFFSDLIGKMGKWGVSTVSAFTEGALGAVSSILPIFARISSLLSFHLAPGSPPRVARQIDVWGEHTMQEYADGMTKANFDVPFKKISKVITVATTSLGTQIADAGFASMQQYAAAVADADIIGPVQKASSRIVPALQDAVASGADKADFGSIGVAVSQEFVDGFLKGLPVLIPAMDQELRDILDRIGSGRQLSAGGAFAMNQFLSGFKLADFSILDAASSAIQDVLQSLVDLGDLDPLDMQRLLFGANEGLAKALEEFRQSGAISKKTLDKVGASAGGAGKFAVQLLNQYVGLAKATDVADAAQKSLNEVTEKYSKILEPLQAQLDKINAKVQFNDEEARILSLKRLIANEGVSAFRKSNAQDEITQIMAERRVRGLEDEQKAATDTGKKTLEAAQKKKDAQQESFDILQANIAAQLKQLGLVSQEGSIVKDLQEEALKLREKQKTELELQLELTRLQNEEMGDLTKAAKAKLILEDSTSSEYAKQQALLDLQEVAISRRNRLLEAAKFGIDPAELTKIRDLIPTMDDLGIKEGKEKFTSDMSAITDGLVDVEGITEQIEAATERVRAKWEEVKRQIIETFVEMNNNLPEFLKFLPDEDGGIPIVGSLTKLGETLGWIAGVVVAKNVVGTLLGVKNALWGVEAASVAAGGVPAVAGLTTLGAALLALGSTIVVVTGYYIALKLAMDAFQADQTATFASNNASLDTALGTAAQPLNSAIGHLLDRIHISPESRSALARTLAETFVSATEEAKEIGAGPEQVTGEIANQLSNAIANNLIADTPENRLAIADFQKQLVNLMGSSLTSGQMVGFENGFNAFAIQPATAEEIAAAKLQTSNFLAGITDAQAQGTFATSMTSLIHDGTESGLSAANLSDLVFNAFGAGVTEGLVKDSPENRRAVSEFIGKLLLDMKAAGEIKSPSALTSREIGEPMGAGIPEGMAKALTGRDGQSVLQVALTALLTAINVTAEDVRAKLVEKFQAAQKDVLAASVATRVGVTLDFDTLLASLKINSAATALLLKTDWEASALVATTSSEAIKTDVTADFTLLGASLVIGMAAIKKTVVDSFTLMQTDSILAVDLLRTGVTATLVGPKDSLLTDLNLGFLGPNNLVPTTMGLTFMEAFGAGILAGKESLAQSMISALSYAVTLAGATLPNTLAPTVGAAGLRPQQSVNDPVGGVNSVRINNYYLTVNSSVPSQGVINDFGIMQTLAGG